MRRVPLRGVPGAGWRRPPLREVAPGLAAFLATLEPAAPQHHPER